MRKAALFKRTQMNFTSTRSNDEATTMIPSPQDDTFRTVHLRYRRMPSLKGRIENHVSSDNDNVSDGLGLNGKNLVVDPYTFLDGNNDPRLERIYLPDDISHQPLGAEDISPGTMSTYRNGSTGSDASNNTQTSEQSNHRHNKALFVYRLKDYPGCLLLPNVLSVSLQLQLAHRAVTQYCNSDNDNDDDDCSLQQNRKQHQQQHPHATNLSSFSPNKTKTDDGRHSSHVSLWNEWKRARRQQQRNQNGTQITNVASSTSTTSNLQSTTTMSPLSTTNIQPRLEKLSWSTMGYHYNWTNRSYPPPLSSQLLSSGQSNHPQTPTTNYSRMPEELQRMATIFSSVTQSYYKELKSADQQPDSQSNDPNYHATACIVNYYHTKSVMGIHRDEVELALHQPVISISIGCAGIFLFGGTSLDVKDERSNHDVDDSNDRPTKSAMEHPQQKTSQPVIPILLRSGDVILFGGPNRLNYHSMPRIIPHSFVDTSTDGDMNQWNDLTILTNPQCQRHRQPHQLQVDNIFDESVDIIQNEADEIKALKDYLSNHRININIRQVY